MDSSERERQIRGAWRAGYEAGRREAAAELLAQGWRVPKPTEYLQPGTHVRLVEPTIFGWTGTFTLLADCGDHLVGRKLDGETVDCMKYQTLVRSE